MPYRAETPDPFLGRVQTVSAYAALAKRELTRLPSVFDYATIRSHDEADYKLMLEQAAALGTPKDNKKNGQTYLLDEEFALGLVTALFRVRKPLPPDHADGLIGGIDCVVTPLEIFHDTLTELGATKVLGKSYTLFRLEKAPIELYFVNAPISKTVMNID